MKVPAFGRRRQRGGYTQAEFNRTVTVGAPDLSWSLAAAEREPDHTQCPHIAGAVVLSDVAFAKVTALMEHFDVEWLAYLIGEWQDESVYVDDLMVPKQETTGSSVDKVDSSVITESVVGVIHSHVRMGAFFSGTDDTWINNNHNVSVVVSKKSGVDHLEFKTQVRKRTVCGINMLMEMQVMREGLNQKSWVDTVKENVCRPTYQYQRPYQGTVTTTVYGSEVKDVDKPLTEAEKAELKDAYNKVVTLLSTSKTPEDTLRLIGTLGDDILEDAALFIAENNGNKDLLDFLNNELDNRQRVAVAAMGGMLD